ncbi:MAG: peptidoglycan-binding domain-containing protein [Candidatus Acidiferrales bacterium]
MRRHNLFAMLLALLLAAAIPAAAQTSAPQSAQKRAGAVSHSTHTGHSRHHSRQPRGQMAPAADRISEIQAALARENAYTGDPTGKWDAATIDAMKRFQTAQGLAPTGKIDALTLQHLGLGSDVAGKGAPTTPETPPPTTPSASLQGDPATSQ